MLRRTLARNVSRSFSMFSPNSVCRFQVPHNIRLQSPIVIDQFHNRIKNDNKAIKITDIYLKLEGVTADPFFNARAKTKQAIEKYTIPVPGMRNTISELRNLGYRVNLYSHYTREQAELALSVLAKQGLEFAKHEIATSCDVNASHQSSRSLLHLLKTRNKVEHPASIISVFDDAPDNDDAIRLGCWGIAQAGFSKHVPVTQEIAVKMNRYELEIQQKKALAELYKQGPNFVTLESDDILEIIEYLDHCMKRGETPLSCLKEYQIPFVKRLIFTSPF